MVGPSSTLGPNPPSANLVGTLALPLLLTIYHLFRKKKKNVQRITKREYIDFADLLADKLSPHPSLTARNQFKLEVNHKTAQPWP